jgi:hypothetical protein
MFSIKTGLRRRYFIVMGCLKKEQIQKSYFTLPDSSCAMLSCAKFIELQGSNL